MNEREKSLRDVAEQFPESPLGWFSLGRYLVEVGRFDEAVAALERALEKDPAYAAALLSLGDAYAALEEKEKALDALDRCAKAALAQEHPSLAAEARARADELA